MDPNKIYNRIIDIIGFLVTLTFIILQILGIINVSWWWILAFLFLPSLFHAGEDRPACRDDNDDDDDDDDWSNNHPYKLV